MPKEQVEMTDRAKTEFLENMRHDIRTPLTGIIGFAELIKKEADAPKIKEYADNLVLATKALLDFQNEILDTIKITTGAQPIAAEPVELKELIEKVINLVRPKAIVKNLSLQFFCDDSLPRFVVSDARRLFRIFLELITNALKFTHKGKITVTLSASRQTKTNIILHCEINDTGIGIPSDQYDDIFIRFHRLSSASDGLYEGTGLGLTVVKKFIEELSGKISVRSVLGKGAAFTFEIPLQISTSVYNSETKHARIETPSYFENPLILLAEDHPMTAKVTQLLLFELGCQVDVSFDAKNTLLQIQKKEYDLILMDIGLPDSNGFLLAKKIRDECGAQIPIVALTAHKESDAEDNCLASGMNAIFQKPLLKSNAIHLLNTYLAKDAVMEKSVIDLVLGAKRINQSESAAKSMLVLLRKNIDADKNSIHTALQKKEWVALSDANHKLLGGLAYCGAPRLESACRKLQDTFKQKDVARILHHATQVLSEIDILKIALPQ